MYPDTFSPVDLSTSIFLEKMQCFDGHVDPFTRLLRLSNALSLKHASLLASRPTAGISITLLGTLLSKHCKDLYTLHIYCLGC
uniref:Uncharacterized protein n=1 Tax=Ignisphaera aggregans TaxID=334771 RepID=A0A7C5XG83_9CREN